MAKSAKRSEGRSITPPVSLVHHAASRGMGYHPNSLKGLHDCLEAGARVVEIDIIPLADGDFALLHNQKLKDATDGNGLVSFFTADEVRRLHLTKRGAVADEPVCVLSEAISLIEYHPNLEELQLDLKAEAVLNDSVLRSLLSLIEPVKGKIRVSSPADWAIRHLHSLDRELLLGFDPLLYFDLKIQPRRPKGVPPFRIGAYGYRDDHPLSSRLWGSSTDYLEARAEALFAQVPDAEMWYIRAQLLACTLDAGFDWIAYLHVKGSKVAVWTLDAENPDHVRLANRLIAANIDRIVTNDAPSLVKVLGDSVEF